MKHVIAVVLVMLAACAFGDSYPPHWQALAAARADCATLEGDYAERGERAASNNPAYLSAVVFGAANPAAARLSIRLLGRDEVEVASWPGGDAEPMLRQTLSVACQDGALVVRKGRWVSEGQGHGRETFTLEFNATDDFLLVRAEESLVGLAVVFPVVASQTRWYRFERLLK